MFERFFCAKAKFLCVSKNPANLSKRKIENRFYSERTRQQNEKMGKTSELTSANLLKCHWMNKRVNFLVATAEQFSSRFVDISLWLTFSQVQSIIMFATCGQFNSEREYRCNDNEIACGIFNDENEFIETLWTRQKRKWNVFFFCVSLHLRRDENDAAEKENKQRTTRRKANANNYEINSKVWTNER